MVASALFPSSHGAEKYAPSETDKSDQQYIDDYLAPELRTIQEDGRYVAPSADWWSFGVVLYQMLTGCLPFNPADNTE